MTNRTFQFGIRQPWATVLRRQTLGLYCILFLCLLPADVVGQNQDQLASIQVRTLNGLKQRRLFDLAINFGASALQDDRLDEIQKTDIVIAIIDVKTQQAFQSRDVALWMAAKDFAAEWKPRLATDRSILISVQEALIDQAAIEQTVLEVQADTRVVASIDAAREKIASQKIRWAELQQQLTVLMNDRSRPNEKDKKLGSAKLLALRYNVEYQLARVLIFQAALYEPAQQSERADMLNVASKQLDLVLQSVGPNEPIWWTVQADRIEVASRLNSFRLAQLALDQLLRQDALALTRPNVKAAWLANLIRENKLEEGFGLVGKSVAPSDSPQVDLARIGLFVTLAGQQKTPDPKNDWQKRALDLTGAVEKRHGGYWGRIANLAVVKTAAATPEANANLDLLMRIADEAQRKKKWGEAIRALDSAATKAGAAGNSSLAFRAGFRAASIQQQVQQHADAANRFEALAARYGQESDAHSAALMACWNQAKVVGKDTEKFAAYETMLEKLVADWPDSASADQGRLWLAAIRSRQKNSAAAVQHLLSVNTASPLFGQAVEQLRSEFWNLSHRSDLAESTRATLFNATVRRLQPLLDLDKTKMPDNWPDTYSQVVLQLAELKFVQQVDMETELAGRLDQVLALPTMVAKKATPLFSDLLALRYVALAHEPNRSVDATIFSSLKPEARPLKILRRGLTSSAPSDPQARTKSQMYLSAFGRYQPQVEKLNARSRQAWWFGRIDALLAVDRTADAIEVAKEFAKSNARNAAAQVRYAELLTQAAATGAAAQVASALSQWRRVAKSSRRNTDNWFVAKLSVARLLLKQNKKQDAKKLLEFIKAVPPGWSKSALAGEFEALLSELAR